MKRQRREMVRLQGVETTRELTERDRETKRNKRAERKSEIAQ